MDIFGIIVGIANGKWKMVYDKCQMANGKWYMINVKR